VTVFVKVRSWHVLLEGEDVTLCGMVVKAHPDHAAGEHQAAGWTETLPAARSCENCLRILTRQNDPAPDFIGEGQPG
jgi:hypothetical protein